MSIGKLQFSANFLSTRFATVRGCFRTGTYSFVSTPIYFSHFPVTTLAAKQTPRTSRIFNTCEWNIMVETA